jgi:hypothetical protein
LLFNRAIQFNSPFSRILFDNFIIDNLTKYFIKYNIKQNTKREKKSEIIREIYNAYYNIGNKGHELFFKTFLIPSIFKLVPKSLILKLWNIPLEAIDISELLTDWIVNYCTEVVDNFFNFKTMTFNYNKYFSEVYSKNVDVYGFIMCYMIYIITDSNQYSLNLKVKISNLIIKYCFSSTYATKVIPVNLLIKDLKNLDNN